MIFRGPTLPRLLRVFATNAVCAGAGLTLLLSLRFMSLVFDEARNIAMGLASRNVDWKAQVLNRPRRSRPHPVPCSLVIGRSQSRL